MYRDSPGFDDPNCVFHHVTSRSLEYYSASATNNLSSVSTRPLIYTSSDLKLGLTTLFRHTPFSHFLRHVLAQPAMLLPQPVEIRVKKIGRYSYQGPSIDR